MKPSEQDGHENSLDLLLFGYVEGNLPADELRSLEARLETDASLREELALWEESVVTADYPDTSRLEKSLLKPAAPAWMRLSLNAWVCLLVTTVLLLRPNRLATETAAPISETLAEAPVFAISHKTAPPMREPEVAAGNQWVRRVAGKPQAKRFRQNLPKTTVEIAAQPDTASRLPFAAIEPVVAAKLPKTAPPPPVALEVRQPKIRKVPVAKTLTRQERRQIRRLKEKALQQRQANEFMKGNVPYVVPLKSDNF
ncbi:MAG: hypothetical protein MUD08_16550 [Cytophagales bacterium]|jgi:anti-sigma factor RsiW|nr:hypothetical protein [Cytophagales bacterium]